MEVKKKRVIFSVIGLLALLVLGAAIGLIYFMKQDKAGIQPYKLTSEEKRLLSPFINNQKSLIMSFNAPDHAVSLKVNEYTLDESGEWKKVCDTGVNVDKEKRPDDKLKGILTMQINEDRSIEFYIDCNGVLSYQSGPIELDFTDISSAALFLTDYKKIQLNQEIPIAIAAYNSNSKLPVYTLDDYFKPERLNGFDLVQAVTVTFTEKDYGEN